MKKQAPLVLSIPHPCTQRWDEMAVTGPGRFCSHCQHCVTDISGMSDTAVHRLLQQGDLRCVRALSSQLNRNISFPPQKATHLYRIAIALGLTIMMVGGTELYARPKAPLTEQSLLSGINDSTLKGRVDPDSITIRGIVVDELGLPFAGVVVKLKEGGLVKGGAVTEDDGTFSISAKRKDYGLEFCSSSYKTERLFVTENSIANEIVVNMKLGNVMYLGQLILPVLPERNNESRTTTIEEEELRRMGY